MIEIVTVEFGLGRLGRLKELGPISRDAQHELLEAVQNAGLLFIDAGEKARMLVMRFDIAGRPSGEFARLGNELFEHLRVEPAFRRHTRDDPDTAHGDVRVFMREQDGRADTLITASGGVGAVNPREHRGARLLELGVTKKRCARAATVRVELLLLGQLRTAAVHEPDERDVEPLR